MTQKRETYSTPGFDQSIQLRLNLNESTCVLADPARELSVNAEAVNRYPSLDELTNLLAKKLGVDPQRVVVTAGGDQAIERIVRTSLSATRDRVLIHSPSFKMVDIYTNNSGGQIQSVEWNGGAFPVDSFVSCIDEKTALVVLVTPNNPTGQVISLDDVNVVAAAAEAQGITLLVDLAYVEFADEDPTAELANHSNVIMVRTFSKAYGLAGLRVGYLVAPNEEVAHLLSAESGPFPVSGVSLAMAVSATQDEASSSQLVEQVKQIRARLTELVIRCGGSAPASQGNFVFAKFEDAESVWQKLAEQGVAVRKYVEDNLVGYLRITCPTNVSDELHLSKALVRATGSTVPLESLTAEGAQEVTYLPDVPTAEGNEKRTANVSRKTKETDIQIELDLDGSGQTEIETGIGFLDHMLTALAFHARFDLTLKCKGDLHIDDHHTAEDCALALGSAIDQALGERKGIVRFGYAYAPLDEALARTVIDLSGRPWPEVHLALQREMVGTIATENITHVFTSLAMSLRCSLHVDVVRGTNDHHKAEAAFKSLALALRKAVARAAGNVPSTKGVL